MSETEEAATVREILRANTLQRCAKLGKRGIHRFRVGAVCFYENVDVFRKAWLRMEV